MYTQELIVFNSGPLSSVVYDVCTIKSVRTPQLDERRARQSTFAEE